MVSLAHVAVCLQATTLITLLLSRCEDDDDDDDGQQRKSLTLVLISTMTMALVLFNETCNDARSGPTGPYNIQKSKDYYQVMLSQDNDRIFRNSLRQVSRLLSLSYITIADTHANRMSATSFRSLCNLLREDPVFQPRGGPGRPPRPVEHQLVTFLLYCGHNSSRLHSATESTIGEGSAYNYVDNVVTALLNVMPQVIRMPEGTERDLNSEEFGIPGAIGAIDCTLIALEEVPRKHRMDYWVGRKKQYMVSAQAVPFTPTGYILKASTAQPPGGV